jgi:hypothetical protein
MGASRSSLYDDAKIASVIERKRIDDGITIAKAAELAGMGSAWSWYKKADGSTPFSVEEVGRFAAAVGAPVGWPFIEWSAAKWLEREMKKP